MSQDIFVLPRYHLENYFLDAQTIASCFKDIEESGSWLLDTKKIDQTLREIARDRLNYTTTLVASQILRKSVGNVDIKPSNLQNLTISELVDAAGDISVDQLQRIKDVLSEANIKNVFTETHSRLSKLLETDTDDWKREFPAKQVFRIFCSKAKFQEGRLKSKYIMT